MWRGEDGERPRRKPTINDELSYEGAGDKHTEADTIAAHLGAFLGGGYGTTGEKYGQKLGQYFWGNFDAGKHAAADNLGWLRKTIDREITFWKLAPDKADDVSKRSGVFTHPGRCYRSGISHNAALKRYLWCQIIPGSDTRFAGGFGIYDAPEPWGPWTTVFFTEASGRRPGRDSEHSHQVDQ